ncbi:MAG: septation protein SpoVG family protein, partial [Candidatus Omnitrophica bacterium]|nr:septation protein SpoVG family protein [Candidatus Omnitrophota bacterium]
RIFLKEGADKKLKAYATLTFDDSFVVRNVKVIQGNKGLFVAMPSRKVKEPCQKCNFKNAVRSRFCNQCGVALPQNNEQVVTMPTDLRQAEHRDIAHPITLECREMIQEKVLEAYEKEVGGGKMTFEREREPIQEEMEEEDVMVENVTQKQKAPEPEEGGDIAL